jgi:hypothetical protein
MHGKMPDVSPALLLSVLTWALAQLVAYGWIDDETKALSLSFASTAVALGVKIWDGYVRAARNKRLAVEAAAGKPAGP